MNMNPLSFMKRVLMCCGVAALIAAAVGLDEPAGAQETENGLPAFTGRGMSIAAAKGCDPDCIACDQTTGSCSQCAAGFFLLSNRCYSCSESINNCQLCYNATTCTKCEPPALMTPDGQCKICTCTDGTRCNPYTVQCDICFSGEKCGCPGEMVSDGSGGCKEGCTLTPVSCVGINGGSESDWRVEKTENGCECVTDKKYVLLFDQHPDIKHSPEKYHRIKAVRDFGNIAAETLGGYIESEANLSQTGDAWVGCDDTGCAIVGDDARVYDNALVSGGGSTDFGGEPDEYGGATRVMNDAQVFGNAKVLRGSYIYAGKVYGNATFHGAEVYPDTPWKPAVPGYAVSRLTIAGEVFGDAHIYAGGSVGGSGGVSSVNNPKVYGSAIVAGGDGDRFCLARVTHLGEVYENAKILRCSEISGGKVHGNAIIRNRLFGVGGRAEIYGNAIVEGTAVVEGNAKMYGNALLSPAESTDGVIPYLCGKAVLAGNAKITAATGEKNSVCKGTYKKGTINWQESYCSSKNCPQ